MSRDPNKWAPPRPDGPIAIDEVRQLLAPPRLTQVLGGREIQRIPEKIAPRRSAVAAILKDGALGPEVLLMKRIERPGDSWSGHISMPGGMRDPRDPDTLATAVRETMEEVGLDLDGAAVRLGRLDDQVAIARGRRLGMAIAPFVFWLEDAPSLTLGPEADSAFWLPIAPTVNGQLDWTKQWQLAGVKRDFPAWRHEGYVVWGLTHRMLTRLFEVAGLQEPGLWSKLHP